MSNQADGVNICQFIDNLDRHHKVLPYKQRTIIL